jgi:hypothetical protein
MATIVKAPEDVEVKQVAERLAEYERDHPGSIASVYRQNGASIRVRIVDARFDEMNRTTRNREACRYTERLPEDIQQQITVLLLLAPGELQGSLMNLEFDDPISSGL